MRRTAANRRLTLLAALALSVSLAAPAALAGCTCDEAKRHQGWCDTCRVGYVAGIRIESEALFEALDAHGHDVDPASLTCEICRNAAASGGFCSEHRMGFVNGEAWLSRLTYEIARGRHVAAVELDCPVCHANAESHGWCDEHSRGMIGHVAIDRREDYDAAARAAEVLLAARIKARDCETCAAAMVVDGRCPVHRIRYRDGEPVASSGH